jgi:hypothetical protein
LLAAAPARLEMDFHFYSRFDMVTQRSSGGTDCAERQSRVHHVAGTSVHDTDLGSRRRVLGPEAGPDRSHLVEGGKIPTGRGGLMPGAKAVESTSISAPPQKIYDFISEATRATNFIPGLSRIHNVKPANAQPGQTWNYEFDWFGVVISGESKCTKSESPRVHEFQTVTGNPSTWTYQIEGDGPHSRLTLTVQYETPDNVVGRFASRAVFEKMNQDRAREIVTNIKAMLES